MKDFDINTWRAFRLDPSEKNFRPIYERTSALVYTICFRALRNAEDAADALQSTYARLLALAKDEAGADAVVNLDQAVRKLAIREADNLRHRRGRRQKVEIAVDAYPISAESGPPPDEAAALLEVREKIDALLESLPDQYRLPLMLHYLQGMTLAEIAEALDKPLGTISTQVARGIRKLRPMARKAGLGDAAMVGAAVGTGALLAPPASLTAASVYAVAQGMVISGGVAAGTAAAGAALWKGTLAGAILSTKGGMFSTGLSLGALLVISLAWVQFSKEQPQPPQAAIERPQAAVAVSPLREVVAEVSAPAELEVAQAEIKKEESAAPAAKPSQPRASGSPTDLTDTEDSSTAPKVGMFFCASSSEPYKPDYSNQASGFLYNYFAQEAVVPFMNGMGFDVYAVVEPGTADKGQLAKTLSKLQLTEKVVNGAEYDQLMKLDAIGSFLNHTMNEDVANAMMKASKAGLGFLIIGDFANRKPGNSDKLTEFMGIAQTPENHRNHEQKMTMEFVGPEEMRIGYLSVKSEFPMNSIAGYTGVVDGTPLFAIKDEIDPDFCPIYMRQNGKGRLLVIQLGEPSGTMDLLPVRTLVQYFTNWVARKKMDTNWKALARTAAVASADSGTTLTEPVGPPIKVGVVFSSMKRPRPHYPDPPIATPWDEKSGPPYARLGNMLVYLESVGCVPYAILDTGDVEDGRLREFLVGGGLADRVLDWNQPGALRTADVILSYTNPFLSGDLTKAIIEAVRGGTGFMAVGETGEKEASDDSILETLIGIKPSKDRIKVLPKSYAGHWVEHHDYQSIIHKPGTKVKIDYVIGYEGEFDGFALIQLDQEDTSLSPCYTRKLGYGRVLVIGCYSFYDDAHSGNTVQQGLENRLYMAEGINWLAGRPLDKIKKEAFELF